jgi:UPF0716 protein FxsA
VLRPRLIWTLVVALLVLPWLEFWLVLNLHWPVWFTLVWCVGAAAAGWWFARGEDLSLWSEIESDIQNRRVPTAEAVDAMLVQIGAWALIVPGLLSDVLGILLLTPLVRAELVEPIRGFIRRRWIEPT